MRKWLNSVRILTLLNEQLCFVYREIQVHVIITLHIYFIKDQSGQKSHAEKMLEIDKNMSEIQTTSRTSFSSHIS